MLCLVASHEKYNVTTVVQAKQQRDEISQFFKKEMSRTVTGLKNFFSPFTDYSVVPGIEPQMASHSDTKHGTSDNAIL
jgi:hypothetical protein